MIQKYFRDRNTFRRISIAKPWGRGEGPSSGLLFQRYSKLCAPTFFARPSREEKMQSRNNGAWRLFRSLLRALLSRFFGRFSLSLSLALPVEKSFSIPWISCPLIRLSPSGYFALSSCSLNIIRLDARVRGYLDPLSTSHSILFACNATREIETHFFFCGIQFQKSCGKLRAWLSVVIEKGMSIRQAG